MNNIKKVWSWVGEVKLFRWIFFLPIGYISYLSFYFLEYAWHSSDNYVYPMMLIIEFFGVFIGVYLTVVIAPKGNLKIARVFFIHSIIMLCITLVLSFLSFQTIVINEILPSLLNLGACSAVLFCMVHNINLLEELMLVEETIQIELHKS